MATYTATQGTPTYPYNLNITDNINVSMSVGTNIIESAAEGSPEFLATLQNVITAAENAYKTLPEFTTQDTSRIGTATYVSKGNFAYDVTVSFTITNAVLALKAATNSDLQGTDLDNLLQSLADSKVAEFKAQWNMIDL
jgi:hypothetical protein